MSITASLEHTLQAPFGETESHSGRGGRDFKDHPIPSPAVGAKSLGKPCSAPGHGGPEKQNQSNAPVPAQLPLGCFVMLSSPGVQSLYFVLSARIYHLQW